MKYAALDFETGNASPLSACALGVSIFEDDHLLWEDSFLIKPPAEVGRFHWGNVRVNGIKEKMVKDAPSFAEIWSQIAQDVSESVIVCHNAPFDTGVLIACLKYYGLPVPPCPYLCTVKVSQQVWPDLDNHRLNTVSEALGIELDHHQAGSDAHAAGLILLMALQETGSADASALAEKIEMQLGRLDADRDKKKPCSTARRRQKPTPRQL